MNDQRRFWASDEGFFAKKQGGVPMRIEVASENVPRRVAPRLGGPAECHRKFASMRRLRGERFVYVGGGAQVQWQRSLAQAEGERRSEERQAPGKYD